MSSEFCELERFQSSASNSLLELLPRDVAVTRAMMIGSCRLELTKQLTDHFKLEELFIADRNAKRLIAIADFVESTPSREDLRVHYSLVDTGGPVKRTQRQVEKAHLPRGGFPLLVSNSELPWHEDLAVHFYFARLLLARGGFYALLGPGPNHLPELFSILGLPPHEIGRHGAFEVDHVAHLAEASGLEVIRRMRTGASVEASSVDAVVTHARKSGILRPSLRAGVLRELTAAYEKSFGRDGSRVRATCDQWLLLLRSPGPLLPRSVPAIPPNSSGLQK